MQAAETPASAPPPAPRPDSDPSGRLADRLHASLRGQARFDRLSRALYATDASIYEIVPAGVVLPADIDDVQATVRLCREEGFCLIPRGAGTGLTGGAVGSGVQLDLSRSMNRVLSIDAQRRITRVQPGVVLDDLNRELAAHGLFFAPDVATSSRATLGGMIANNSCGARSIVFGRTVDYVAELTVVLADGEVVRFAAPSVELSPPPDAPDDRAMQIERSLADIRDRNHQDIIARYPRILRSNGGYGLDRLGSPGQPAPAVKVLCGSEGTLGIVVEATLRLVPTLPRAALVALHFADLFDALGCVPAILAHQPSAVELVDKMILDAGLNHAAHKGRCGFVQGRPAALLLVEFLDEHAERLPSRAAALAADPAIQAVASAASVLLDPADQKAAWTLRQSGLGLLMSRPGDLQPLAFVEDSAVDPPRLREYIQRFNAILSREGVSAGFYAHASVGCLHVRPVINLKRADNVQRMRRIADAVSSLALEFGGAMTAEHGDGILRSCWLEKMYGPRIVAAFREVKNLFGPHGLLNPHKIVDPYPMTEHLRYGPAFKAQDVKTHLDFSAYGGLAGLAGMCSGVGQCRQRRVQTMCPSFMATGDETHTTRARANALRLALSNRGLLRGLEDSALEDVMDLCLACKACKTECPTGVDMARLKAEYLAQRHLHAGSRRSERFIADLPARAARASRLPALANLLARSRLIRLALERLYGLDRRIVPPPLARRTFRAWFRRHRRTPSAPISRGRVVYFADTWTNYFLPRVGIAAVTLLERAGFEVLCPATLCCGRPAISQGFLPEVAAAAEQNVLQLLPYAAEGVPIVGSEPSCVSTLVDEYPQLVRTPAANIVAAHTATIESFLARTRAASPQALRFTGNGPALLYHGHCHRKALWGCDDVLALLRSATGSAVAVDAGCCGMAGAFGHQRSHYDVARAIGEERLFPAVRNRGDAQVAVCGFSCRQQIEHHTAITPRHVLEHLAAALA